MQLRIRNLRIGIIPRRLEAPIGTIRKPLEGLGLVLIQATEIYLVLAGRIVGDDAQFLPLVGQVFIGDVDAKQ